MTRRGAREAALLLVAALLLGAPSLGAQGTTGRIEGTARAGAGSRPPREVEITLTRVEPEPVITHTTTADSLGRWHVDSLEPGRYLMEVSSPLLDSLQLAIGAREIRIAGGDTVRAELALPSEAAVHSALLEAAEARAAESVDTTTGALLLTGTASVAGRVTGATNEPVAGVQLSVRDARGVATSDSSGRFVLAGLPAGARVLVARRIGYALVEQVVELRAGQRATVDVRLERMAALDSMRVTALGGRYREFEFNRGANIFGRYLTRDQILRRRPADNAALLFRLGGFTVIGQGGTAIVYSKREMRKANPCPANVVIDGVQKRRINDVRADRDLDQRLAGDSRILTAGAGRPGHDLPKRRVGRIVAFMLTGSCLSAEMGPAHRPIVPSSNLTSCPKRADQRATSRRKGHGHSITRAA